MHNLQIKCNSYLLANKTTNGIIKTTNIFSVVFGEKRGAFFSNKKGNEIWHLLLNDINPNNLHKSYFLKNIITFIYVLI